MTHDVRLAPSQTPSFPPRCVVCEREQPGSTAEVTVLIAAPAQSLGADVIDVLAGSTPVAANRYVTFSVPACAGCQGSLRRWHGWKQVAQYAGPLLGVALLICFATLGLTFVGFVFLALGIVVPIIYDLIWPPAFGVTGTGGTIIYEFRSQRCAEEFGHFNPPPWAAASGRPDDGAGDHRH